MSLNDIERRFKEAKAEPQAQPQQQQPATTANRYQHLENEQLVPSNAQALPKAGSNDTVKLEQMETAVLLVLQHPSTVADGTKLMEEKAKIDKEQSKEACWMTTRGLPGCGKELLGWKPLVDEIKKRNLPVDVFGLNVKDSKYQALVAKEKELNFSLLSITLKQAKAWGLKVGNFKGEEFLERATLLLYKGKLIKSYDVSLDTPGENATKIFPLLVQDLQKLNIKLPEKRKPVDLTVTDLATHLDEASLSARHA